jgi:hypothetical protein
VGVVSAVLILLSLAAVFLINNFGEVGFGDSWPVLLIAAGLSLALAGYLELGLGIGGVFVLVLLANLDVIAPFSKSWPFVLIWIAVLVVVGFLRARASGRKTAS